MATTKTELPDIRRASDFAPGIGANLEAILGRDVVVKSVEVADRPFKGETRKIVFVTLDTNERYHAWSDSLAEKLEQIPEDAYPLVFNFSRVKTSTPGFTVYTFE